MAVTSLPRLAFGSGEVPVATTGRSYKAAHPVGAARGRDPPTLPGARNLSAPLSQGFGWQATGGRDGYRLRIGGWRSIANLDAGRRVMLVVDVAPRGDVYK